MYSGDDDKGELRLTISPDTMTLRFEYSGLEATYLCGLSSWILLGVGTDCIPYMDHAVWHPRAGPEPASIEISPQSAARGLARSARGSSHANLGNYMEERGVSEIPSGFFSHGRGSMAPLAPRKMPACELFNGFDPNA